MGNTNTMSPRSPDSMTEAASPRHASETRSLRSASRTSMTDQSHEKFQQSSQAGPIETEQPAKRLRLSVEPPVEQKPDISKPAILPGSLPTGSRLGHCENSLPSQDKEQQESKRRTWTLPKTKRASSLNLHNHPTIAHPVGIAIWLLQKIDQARINTDGERSEPNSGLASPSTGHQNWETVTPGPRVGSMDTSMTFTGKPASLTGAAPVWGPANPVEHSEDDSVRREAQRQRKTKQRNENWAKNKENDVVARAKLEAKKRYGTSTDKEREKQEYTNRRIEDDYDRLLNRQTSQFADFIAQLPPFQFGFGDAYVARLTKDANAHDFAPREPTVEAARLLLNVLPALAENTVSPCSRFATNAFLHALQQGYPPADAFFHVIDALAEEENILHGIDKILGLIMQRSDDRRSTRSRPSSSFVSGQSALPRSGTSPHPAVPSRFTWKEPTTLHNNNFASYTPPPSYSQSIHSRQITAPTLSFSTTANPGVQATTALDPTLGAPPNFSPLNTRASLQGPPSHAFPPISHSLAPTAFLPLPPALPNGAASLPTASDLASQVHASSSREPPTPSGRPAKGSAPSDIATTATLAASAASTRIPPTRALTATGQSLPGTATTTPIRATSIPVSAVTTPVPATTTLFPAPATAVPQSTVPFQLITARSAAIPATVTPDPTAHSTVSLVPEFEPPATPGIAEAPEPTLQATGELHDTDGKLVGAQGAAKMTPTITSNTFTPIPTNPPYFTPPAGMPRQIHVQSRSSNRERKPTAKVLAASSELPPRLLTKSPLSTVSLNSVRPSRSSPRIPSKLGLSHSISDQAGTPPPTQTQTPLDDTQVTVAAESLRPTTRSLSAKMAHKMNIETAPFAHNALNSTLYKEGRSLQMASNASQLSGGPRIDTQHGLNPEYTSNLLLLSEIAANMSDSDDEEESEPDFPNHERLVRAIEGKYSPQKQQLSSSGVEKESLTTLNKEKPATRHSSTPVGSTRSSRNATPDTAMPPLPAVNTIMSAEEAKAMSVMFKELASGGPVGNNHGHEDANPLANVSSTNVNGDWGDSIQLKNMNGVSQPIFSDVNNLRPGSPPQLPTTGGSLAADGTAGYPPHQIPQIRQSPDRKRKFDDEAAGTEIALSRLRFHAQNRGLAVDPSMSVEELNEIIERHDASISYRNGNTSHIQASLRPNSAGAYFGGLMANGNKANGAWDSYHSPNAVIAPRPLAYSSFTPVNTGQRYDLLPTTPNENVMTPPPSEATDSDALQPTSHILSSSRSPVQFVPQDQPRQSKRICTKWTNGPTPTTVDGEETIHYNTSALNGGPPGGGAIINTRERQDARMRRGSKAPDFKLHIKGSSRQSPIEQRKPKKGGQLISFGQN